MTDLIDRIHFRDLSEKSPKEVCERTGSVYNKEKDQYSLTVWDEKINIFPGQFRVESENDNGGKNNLFHFFAIHYLLTSKPADPSGSWISEKEVPSGAAFFRGPHRIPTEIVTKRFKNDLDGFKTGCEAFGGKPIEMAEAAFTFSITPTIPVATLYWRGDDDFPAEFKMLFDRTISVHFQADVIFGLAVDICRKLKRAPDVC